MAGRTQGWVWKHFYTDRINYKTDKTHHNAWCSAELKFAKLFHFQKLGLSEETPSRRVGKDVDYFWKGAVTRNLSYMTYYRMSRTRGVRRQQSNWEGLAHL
jgi:hypothetical protein